jgi:Mrp family chromosome partitioning ATPase/capsular polysaccharide biosynthesis protein
VSPYSYLRWLRENWACVATFTLIGIIVALAFSLSVKPKFVATSEIFLSTPRFGNVSLPADSPFLADGFSQQRARSYVPLASRVDLARRVVDRLGIDLRPADLAAATSAWTPPDTVLLDIAVESSSPHDAKILADAVTAELATDIRTLESRSGQVIPVVEPVVTKPAETPTKPSEPQIATYLLFGASGGFLAGVTAAAMLRRRRIEGTELEQITGRPVLGAIVFHSAASQDASGGRRSTFNRARWQWNDILKNLAFEMEQTGDQVLAVATENGSGRGSAAAAGLASACANAGSRVALLLMRPKTPERQSSQERSDVGPLMQSDMPKHHSNQERPDVGLADLIAGEARLDDAIQPTDNQNLYFIAGPELESVAPLLRSEKFRGIIGELRESFDLIILDSPDFFQLAACTPLPEAIDSVILVVEERNADRHHLALAMRLIVDKNVRLLGSILESDSSGHSHARTVPSLVASHEGLDR